MTLSRSSVCSCTKRHDTASDMAAASGPITSSPPTRTSHCATPSMAFAVTPTVSSTDLKMTVARHAAATATVASKCVAAALLASAWQRAACRSPTRPALRLNQSTSLHQQLQSSRNLLSSSPARQTRLAQSAPASILATRRALALPASPALSTSRPRLVLLTPRQRPPRQPTRTATSRSRATQLRRRRQQVSRCH